MKKVLSLFFVLVSLLGGCAQENTTSKIDENTRTNSGVETSTDTNNSEIKESEQPFLIEDCVHELKNDRYSFYITVRNNSGESIDSPTVFIDFLNENQDILCSGEIYYTGILKDGQSFMDLQYYDDFQFEFSLVDDFRYISVSAYSEDGEDISVSSPQIFSLS